MQIVENCRRTISFLQGYSKRKLYCKKLSNQKPTANTVRNARKTTLCWMQGKISTSIYQSYCIFVLLFSKNLSKARYSMYGNLLPVLAPKVPVLRRNKATRCGINSGNLTDPCIQQNLFSLYCELYLLLICNAYPLVIDIQDVAPGSYQIRPELLQTFQPSYASSIAWISSDYFEPLLLPQ